MSLGRAITMLMSSTVVFTALASVASGQPPSPAAGRQWNSVRTYLIKDGHLFLGLIADGGVYELAPLAVR